MTYREDRYQDFLDRLSGVYDLAALWYDAVSQERERALGTIETDVLMADAECSAALGVFGAISDALDLARRVGA
ncbi:hypothetical protein ACFXPA_44390 [Amycolatopsis sp. NPDC059090]|uniref:hypothetical protein n=1 Tax=unclassified Amycolatopsis TaxID=2618356 RepID=UPI00367009F3